MHANEHPARPARRVLAIGLDGATFRLIRPWAEAGHLPHLARLLREGAWGDLRSIVQPSSEQAWASFATGVQNGKHGIYGFVQRVPGTYQLEYVNGRHQRARTLWRILSDRGRPVIAINVPMTYPPEPVHGVLTEAYLRERPVRFAEEGEGQAPPRREDGYSEEEARTIEERLQGLGYL